MINDPRAVDLSRAVPGLRHRHCPQNKKPVPGNPLTATGLTPNTELYSFQHRPLRSVADEIFARGPDGSSYVAISSRTSRPLTDSDGRYGAAWRQRVGWKIDSSFENAPASRCQNQTVLTVRSGRGEELNLPSVPTILNFAETALLSQSRSLHHYSAFLCCT